MAIRSGNIGSDVDTLSLGAGSYASDAAAITAWNLIARRTSGAAHERGPGDDLPAGVFYYDSTNTRIRVADGSGGWSTLSFGGPGAATLDNSYNNGTTITADAGAITINKTDATAVFRVDLDGAVASPVMDINIDALTTSPLFDIDVGAGIAWAQDVFNINLSNAGVGSQILVVPNDGLAHTTAGFVIDADNAGAGSASWIDLTSAGIDTGALIDLDRGTAAATGAFIKMDSDAANLASVFLDINVIGIQTANVIEIDFTTTGSANAMEVAAASTWTGDVINWNNTNSVGAQLLVVPTTASIMTAAGWLLNAANSGNTNADWIDLTATGAGSGSLVDLNWTTAAGTGDFISITTDATAVATRALDIDIVGIHTVPVIDIDVTTTGASTIFDVAFAGAWTGNVINIDQTTAVGSQAIVVADSTGIMTAAGWALDIACSGAASGDWIDLRATGAGAGNLIDLNWTGAAGTGDFIAVTTDATAVGTRVMDLDIVGIHTVPLFDIDYTTTASGNTFDVAFAGAATLDVINILFTNAPAAQAMVLPTTAEVMSAAGWVINAANSGNTNVDWLDLTATGAGSGNLIDLNWTTAAGTGDAIGVTTDATAVAVRHLDLNCAGIQTVNLIDIDATAASTASAIAIDTAGVGAAGVAGGMTVTGTGNLVAGADLVRILSSGTLSSSSNLLALENTTASGGATSYNLYINADAANVEAIHVDAGTVLIDETLGVTGGFTTAPIYAATTQLIADPGNAGAVPVTADGVCTITTGGAETRTVADPAYIGQNLTLIFDVDLGNVVFTFASNVVDTDGGDHNTLTWDDATDGIILKGGYVAGALAWFAVEHLGAAVNANFTSV